MKRYRKLKMNRRYQRVSFRKMIFAKGKIFLPILTKPNLFLTKKRISGIFLVKLRLFL